MNERNKFVDLSSVSEQRYDEVIENISGLEMEKNLLSLARKGGRQIEGTPEQPVKYTPTRIALSTEDDDARIYEIKPLMEEAGMEVFMRHPLGIMGRVVGTNPDLAPIVIMSHTDTIPDADMYDGTVGVIGGIEVVKALRDARIKPERTIIVLALSGEESSGYNIALFGSKAMFHGLEDADLDSRKNPNDPKNSPSIREILTRKGVNIDLVKQPVFGPKGILLPTPTAVIELHVDQDGSLERKGLDVAVVEAIAAPERHSIAIGDTLLSPDTTVYTHVRYVSIQAQGKADHSGATQMGQEYRADGLSATAHMLLPILQNDQGHHISIGNITVEGQAMNKIPGVTTTMLRVTGESDEEISEILKQIEGNVLQQNIQLLDTSFPPNPLTMQIASDNPEQITFYKPDEIEPRQLAALELVTKVEDAAMQETEKKTVGTIGTITLKDGVFTLGADIRGIDLDSRNRTIGTIQQSISQMNTNINFGQPLPGSGKPTLLNEKLVTQAEHAIERYGIGKSAIVYSPAGHDTQNAAREGIPSVMIFCQSHDGIAHNPDAYTSPKNLAQGARALAAVVMDLAVATNP